MRTALRSLVAALGLLACPPAGHSLEPPSAGTVTPPEPPSQSPPAGPEPTDVTIDAEEAIRLATDLFDRLESLDADDDARALLEQANGYIEVVQAKDSTSPWLSYLYGRAFAVAGRPWDAVQQLRSFAETAAGRNEWRVYRILGDLFQSDYPQLAKADYEKAAALKANEPSVQFGLSTCALRLGDLKGAIRLGREAVAADGRRSIRYLSHLGRILSADREWDDAVRETEAALVLAQQAHVARPGDLASLQQVDTQYRLVISILVERIRQTDEDAIDARLELARYIRRRGSLALELLLHDELHILESGADKTAPDTPLRLLEPYGATLAEVGRTDDAVAVFKTILARDPENKIATEWLARLRPKSASHEALSDPPN